jgi:two-component system cell cycle sensor histidine kinase/response regulator CckA
VTRVLRNAGYVVQAAAGGPEALEAIDNGGTFDLVVTDVRMPGMSGPRFVGQLRRQATETKVLYLTGYNDQLFDERGNALWVDEVFLDKPCTVNGLLESVSLLLTGHVGPIDPPSAAGPRQH